MKAEPKKTLPKPKKRKIEVAQGPDEKHEAERRERNEEDRQGNENYAEGGEVGEGKTEMYAMEPDVPAMHGMEEDGEPDASGIDDELNDMVAGELLDAIEKKDKQAILESIKALVMSCGGDK